MPIAAIAGVALATGMTIWPEWQRLTGYVGRMSPQAILRAFDLAYLYAFAFGLLSIGVAIEVLRGRGLVNRARPSVERAESDNHGHADWLSMREARRLFPGPDPAYGGLVVGEAYRVDQDRGARSTRVAAIAFDPANRKTWGSGGTAPLLVDPCRSSPTHALVVAGSGGFKTTSVGVPTMLTWTGSAVVLDPSREIGPMVARFRERDLGHRTLTLDPGDAAAGSLNVLDWIDIASPLAESNVEAVVGWVCGEPDRRHVTSGAEFFRESAMGLIACLLADLLWDEGLDESEKTLKRVRHVLVTPEPRCARCWRASTRARRAPWPATSPAR